MKWPLCPRPFLIHTYDFSPTASGPHAPMLVSPVRIAHVRFLLAACLATVGAVVSPLGDASRPRAAADGQPRPGSADQDTAGTPALTSPRRGLHRGFHLPYAPLIHQDVDVGQHLLER
jgi:hypothetical protein